MKIIFYCILYYGLINSLLASIYRPYDIYRTSAHSLAEGGTGTSNIDSISDIPMNPAYLASITKGGVGIGLDAQIRITTIKTDFSLKPYYIPLANIAFSLTPNSGIGFNLSAPFQRIFPDSFVINYFWELAYGYTLFRYLDVGITFGAVMGVDSQRYTGGGASGSISLLSRGSYGSFGFFYRPTSLVTYSSFPQATLFQELLPHILRAGYSKKFSILTFTFELEYITWNTTSYKLNKKEIVPTFQPHFFNFVHPHIGLAFLLERWLPGLTLRTGLFTEDFFDYQGKNNRQVLLSLGFSALAYSDIWEDRLRIDFAYVTSSLFSLFWSENTQIDKFQLTISYQFDPKYPSIFPESKINTSSNSDLNYLE